MFRKTGFPISCVAALIAAGLTTGAAAADPATASTSKAEPPNVLLILADDMGFSDAGC